MNEIIVREANLKDIPRLRKFEQGLIEAERPCDVTIKENPLLYYDLEKILEDVTAHVLVAEYEKKVVACGMVLTAVARPYLRHDNYANIRFLYTEEAYRGKGINAMIIAALKKWANANGLTEIRLTVYQDNIPAIKAYEKVGFAKHIIEMRLP